MFVWFTLIVCIHYACSDAATNTAEGNSTLSLAQQYGIELVTTENENALEKVDQLSLVTRYAGVGYNKLRGILRAILTEEELTQVSGQLTWYSHIHTECESEHFIEGEPWQFPIKSTFTCLRAVQQVTVFKHLVEERATWRTWIQACRFQVSSPFKVNMNKIALLHDIMQVVTPDYLPLFILSQLATSIIHKESESAMAEMLWFTSSMMIQVCQELKPWQKKKKRVIIQKTKICNYGTARYLIVCLSS